jgi:succinate dehydrogenase/fumarate reductase cytochrome b subunit
MDRRTPDRQTLDRQTLAERILKIDGILLLVVAAIHLAATPLALNFISSQSTPEAWAQIKPPFLLSFVVVGILLIPLGLSTYFSFNAVSVLMLPLALILTMPVTYFRAIPFLIAAILVCIVAISMAAPLVLSRRPKLPAVIPSHTPPA